MEQPDHMVDIVIILSVNFKSCKISYQVGKWGPKKGTKKGLSSFRFFKFKKKKILIYFFIIIKIQELTVAFHWSHKSFTWYLILHGHEFTDKKITLWRQ